MHRRDWQLGRQQRPPQWLLVFSVVYANFRQQRPAPAAGTARLPLAAAVLLALSFALPLAAGANDLVAAWRYLANESIWQEAAQTPELSRSHIIVAIEGARQYLLANQRSDGNFRDFLDFRQQVRPGPDNQVHQAGALWALASISRDRPTRPTQAATIRGIDFFLKISETLLCGEAAPIYPESLEIHTATVAQVALALIEFIRGHERQISVGGRGLYETWLSRYLDYLQAMEIGNGSWASTYAHAVDQRNAQPDAAADALALLAYCRAARYCGRSALIPKIEAAMPRLLERYTINAWKANPNSPSTRAFFAPALLACAEYVEAGWKNADIVADAALAMVWWKLYEDQLLARTGNSAYALEGLLAAARIARHQNNSAATTRLDALILPIIARNLRLQIDGPFAAADPYMLRLPAIATATGGIVNHRGSGIVRISNVQYFLNAMLMYAELYEARAN